MRIYLNKSDFEHQNANFKIQKKEKTQAKILNSKEEYTNPLYESLFRLPSSG